MKIESASSLALTNIEELAMHTGWAFIRGALSARRQAVNPWKLGRLFAITEVAKFAFNNLVQAAAKKYKLPLSAIQYVTAGSNLLIDTIYLLTLVRLNFITSHAAFNTGLWSLFMLGMQIHTARKLRAVDFPFTGRNFNEPLDPLTQLTVLRGNAKLTVMNSFLEWFGETLQKIANSIPVEKEDKK